MRSPSRPVVCQEIKLAILQMLGSEYPAGSKLPPAPELARQRGWGQRNTQRAVQELAREQYLLSRPRQGTIVADDITDRLRVAPRRGVLTGRRVAIVTARRYPLPFIRAIISSARRVLQHAGARIEIVRYRNTQRCMLGELADADAYILVNPNSGTMPVADEPRNVVVVSTASSTVDTLGGDINFVTVNDEHGSMLAGRAMRDAGCRSACFIGVRDSVDIGAFSDLSRLRLRGFEAGWNDALPEAHHLFTTAYGDTSGAHAFRHYLQLDPRPDGVFAADDETAYGFMLAAMGAGLEIGRDYHLIGFDDQHLSSNHGHGYLFASVAVPAREMGRAAARIIKRRAVQPDTPVQRIILGCNIRHSHQSSFFQEIES